MSLVTTNRSLLLALLCAGLLTACSGRAPVLSGSDSAPARRLDPNTIADATPRAEPKSTRGNPASYVVLGKRYYTLPSSRGYIERGIASWYGTKFHGRSTSSGEPYDMYAMTAAHKSLPLPTYVQVTNLRNGRSAIVKVNDRGPFHDNRLIDLSYAAATKLGIVAEGTGLVEVRALDPGTPTTPAESPVILANQASLPAPPALFVQVGAFSSRHNANQLSQRLAGSLSQQVRIQQVDNQGQRLYRVQIGPLASVEQVDELSQSLPRLGIMETQVIID
ncbi:septal ring lytic transglycosylase RlpA family protein [Sedimenticola thiotaurini]|uniref:Endolytic peptidoglycan transglycosylase RlpA n=1 Tax=Sedimenticola thiotaurini TaxID=1543721 RepID=A0A0F7K2A3_9GAMM|nr:septal ring lytic transglycosylase RlpA family protein [Sedimenticola thiotaurini]AKH21335.1 lipoprotein [Sedimenticola thiotaurini]